MRRLRYLAMTGVTLSLCIVAGADTGTLLQIGPRWGTMWLSPDLTGNLITLEYKNSLPADSKAKGTVILELPAEIQCVWAGNIRFEEAPGENGGRNLLRLPAATLTALRPDHAGGWLYLKTTLKPGAVDTGKAWAEWEGGKSAVTTFDIQVIASPVVSQPKRFMAGVGIRPYTSGNWPDFIRQYASLGFNHIDFWHGVIHNTSKPSPSVLKLVEQARANNIIVSVDCSWWWDTDVLKEDPDSLAVFANDGRRGTVKDMEICPSYRGPGIMDRIKRNAQVARSGISSILSDEESYGHYNNFHYACVCPRCEERWKQWLPVHRPLLEHRSAQDVVAKYEKMPEYWRAWTWFRASLTTERYAIIKQEIVKAVQEHGAESSPRPMLGWWSGHVDPEDGVSLRHQDGRGLAEVIDFVQPMVYYRYQVPPREFRAIARRQAWAMDRRNSHMGIDGDDDFGFANQPGILLAGVLETVFAGHTGYCMWVGDYMDTRQYVELAAANNVIAKHENVFLKGKETDLFRCFVRDPDAKPMPGQTRVRSIFPPWSDDVCTSTWENDEEGLLLITDYREQRTHVWIERSRQYIGPMKLYDAFSDDEVTQLTKSQWDFRIQLEKSPVRLLYWKKKG